VATGLESIPIDGRPCNLAAKLVVPRPQKGSNIQSPGCADDKILKGKSRGNMVKYGQIAFNLKIGELLIGRVDNGKLIFMFASIE
jgi:hypothetical protein